MQRASVVSNCSQASFWGDFLCKTHFESTVDQTCQKLGKSRVRQSFLAAGYGWSRGVADCEIDVNSRFSFSIEQGTFSSYSSSDTLKVDGGWKICWETIFFPCLNDTWRRIVLVVLEFVFLTLFISYFSPLPSPTLGPFSS